MLLVQHGRRGRHAACLRYHSLLSRPFQFLTRWRREWGRFCDIYRYGTIDVKWNSYHRCERIPGQAHRIPDKVFVAVQVLNVVDIAKWNTIAAGRVPDTTDGSKPSGDDAGRLIDATNWELNITAA